MGYRPHYTSGDWLAICDVCGRLYEASSLRQRWDGFMVCHQDFETRHPQDFVRGVIDMSNTPWSRSEASDEFIGFTETITTNLNYSVALSNPIYVGGSTTNKVTTPNQQQFTVTINVPYNANIYSTYFNIYLDTGSGPTLYVSYTLNQLSSLYGISNIYGTNAFVYVDTKITALNLTYSAKFVDSGNGTPIDLTGFSNTETFTYNPPPTPVVSGTAIIGTVLPSLTPSVSGTYYPTYDQNTFSSAPPSYVSGLNNVYLGDISMSVPATISGITYSYALNSPFQGYSVAGTFIFYDINGNPVTTLTNYTLKAYLNQNYTAFLTNGYSVNRSLCLPLLTDKYYFARSVEGFSIQTLGPVVNSPLVPLPTLTGGNNGQPGVLHPYVQPVLSNFYKSSSGIFPNTFTFYWYRNPLAEAATASITPNAGNCYIINYVGSGFHYIGYIYYTEAATPGISRPFSFLVNGSTPVTGTFSTVSDSIGIKNIITLQVVGTSFGNGVTLSPGYYSGSGAGYSTFLCSTGLYIGPYSSISAG